MWFFNTNAMSSSKRYNNENDVITYSKALCTSRQAKKAASKHTEAVCQWAIGPTTEEEDEQTADRSCREGGKRDEGRKRGERTP